MKSFKNISLAQSYRLRYTINGVAWLVYAICRLFDNSVCQMIKNVALVVAIMCLTSFFRKAEDEDEMAMKHIYRAKAYSFDIIYGVILLIGMASIAGKNLIFSIDDICGFVIAVANILIGCIFSHLERVGD